VEHAATTESVVGRGERQKNLLSPRAKRREGRGWVRGDAGSPSLHDGPAMTHPPMHGDVPGPDGHHAAGSRLSSRASVGGFWLNLERRRPVLRRPSPYPLPSLRFARGERRWRRRGFGVSRESAVGEGGKGRDRPIGDLQLRLYPLIRRSIEGDAPVRARSHTHRISGPAAAGVRFRSLGVLGLRRLCLPVAGRTSRNVDLQGGLPATRVARPAISPRFDKC